MRRAGRALGVFAILLACACSRGASPAAAVRAFIEASEVGSRGEVFSLLGPASRARLEADARRAADVSGRRAIRPEELLAVGGASPRFRPDTVREVERRGDEATVEVR